MPLAVHYNCKVCAFSLELWKICANNSHLMGQIEMFPIASGDFYDHIHSTHISPPKKQTNKQTNKKAHTQQTNKSITIKVSWPGNTVLM